MHLETLEVNALRNISRLLLRPDRRINWITGGNGAGKTTLLEAIYLLARGRSFRGSKHGSMVQEGQREARIAGRFGSEKGGSIRIDFGKRQSASLDATNAKGVIWTIGEGGARAQVRVVGENAQKLIESGPEIRRLFMDWNLFHVEQSYGPALKRFKRIQQQRNAWLKAGGAGCPVWDEPYLACSREITTKRFLYVDLLQRRLSDAYSELNGGIAPVSIRLDRGWPPHAHLSDLLRSHYRKDVDRGFTYYGPSRADLLIRGIGVGGVGFPWAAKAGGLPRTDRSGESGEGVRATAIDLAPG